MSELVAEKHEAVPAEAKPVRWIKPRYDVHTVESGDYNVRVVMPGVDKEGVHVSLENRMLHVTGTRKHHAPDEWTPVMREYREDDYRIDLELNVAVDSANIAAHVEDGVLNLTLPVAEEAKPRVIDIG